MMRIVRKSGDVKTAASATAGNTTRYDGRMEEVKHTLDFGPPIPGLPHGVNHRRTPPSSPLGSSSHLYPDSTDGTSRWYITGVDADQYVHLASPPTPHYI
jgi:hypothetical protein